ncbi:MAG TPA: cytochrome oxidase biogenesis protein Surf1,facilitates heme A insertion [Gammaproteobacteria bacterium]|nr:cytochrome oxidase biogenesis protein Surf1,facilitates heme A insertion [Gammaproteobacteria bacterium]
MGPTKPLGSVEFNGFRLSISWFGVIVLLVCLPILLSLGRWQLQRAEYKTELLLELELGQLAEPVGITSLAELESLPKHGRVEFSGEYLRSRSLLLDNRYYRNRVGFEVVSLFRLEKSAEVLLVNRGWLPLGRLRYPLPEIDEPAGPQKLSGEVRPVPTDTLVLEEEHFDDWPQLVQKIDPDQLSELSGYSLPRTWVLLGSDSDSSLKREWPVVVVGPERHYGYSVQWFGLSLALVVIVIASGLKKVP